MSRCERPLKNGRNGDEKRFVSKRQRMLKELKEAARRGRRRGFLAFLQECRFNLVQDVFEACGAKPVDLRKEWIIAWIDAPIYFEFFSKLKSYQRINHFPGMSEICNKRLLAQNLNKMRNVLPESYNFYPLTFCLPDDELDLSKFFRKKKKSVFIIKPDLTSQGAGIDLVTGTPDWKKFHDVVCQKYISSPLLMDGFKFDLRIYVLVTSIVPLRIFIYDEGLVRLATIPYQKPKTDNIKEKRMHLTNYAINRPTKTDSNESTADLCKKSFADFNKLMLSKGVSPVVVWEKIDDIVVKTILSALPRLEHMFHLAFPIETAISPCFELLGFDVILDKKCRPFLLEVNRSPSLGGSTTFDILLKRKLMKNILDMVLLTPKQIAFIKDEEHMKSLHRLTNNTLIKCQTPREMILADHQESSETQKAGNFRQIFPAVDGRYDESFDVTYRLKGREKLITKSTEPTLNFLGRREKLECIDELIM